MDNKEKGMKELNPEELDQVSGGTTDEELEQMLEQARSTQQLMADTQRMREQMKRAQEYTQLQPPKLIP